MGPSEQCKAGGLKSLVELERISNVSKRTLINWHNTKQRLFSLMILGAAIKKKETK